MVPAFLIKRFGETGAKIALVIIAAVLVTGAYFTVRQFFLGGAKTEIKLQAEQGKAATASGKDAVGTLGNTMANEAAADTITRENADAIRNAQGADAPIAPPLRDAGIASLCRRAAYHSDPRCVQRSTP